MTLSLRRLRPLSAALAVVTLTALYLAGPARDVMDLTTAAAVLLHIILGTALIIPAGWALLRAFQRISSRYGRSAILCLALFASICALSGLYLAARAATGHSTARDILPGQLHILAGIAAVILAILTAWFQRPAPRNPASETPKPPVPLNDPARRSGRSAALSIALLLTLTQGALFGTAAMLPTYRADDYYRDLTATNAEQAQNPLFPAGLRLQTRDGAKADTAASHLLPSSASCGESGCHPAAYQEWQQSAHHFAGTDPFYTAALQPAALDTRQWCQGCHAPYAAIQAAAAESSSSEIRRQGAAEGVGCFTCHATVGTPTRTGDGRFVLAEPQDYPFAAQRGWRHGLHDFLLRVRPGPHQRAFLKPELHGSSEFCSGCHRQSLTAVQNHYQFVRGADEYGEWARASASGRVARSPAASVPRTCQDCHFRALPGKSAAGPMSHLSPGGNTALAAMGAVNGVSSEAVAARLRGTVTLDLFALRRADSGGRGETWIAPLDSPRAAYALHPGETCRLDIVVRNQGAGHSFPAGYLDLTEAWLEVTVSDAQGRVLLTNGVPADPVSTPPPGAHVYSALGLDRLGGPILWHNLTDQVTTAYQHKIPAGGSDIARYRLVIPAFRGNGPKANGALRITARLRYRSVRPDFAAWALASARTGRTAPGAGFVPPITTLAETTLSLPLRQPSAAPESRDVGLRRAIAERYLHYGAGLLTPQENPDIAGAVHAFSAAGELAADRPDPWLGLGRTYLREPDLRLAAANFERAVRCAPGNPAAVAELSTVFMKQGQPDRAIQSLTPLIEQYPEDETLRLDLGLALFQAGRYAQAAESFRRALAIDPDDYAAHFKLKFCYEVTRNVAEARREDSITRYLAEDRAGPRLVPPYLSAHPEAARRAESFPVHILH